MRPLSINDEAKKKVQAVLDYARPKAHWYSVDLNQFQTSDAPGNIPEYICFLDTYRCVFSYSHIQHRLYRHLSVSIPGENYPNVVAVLYIAQMFGFTGWDQRTTHVPVDWLRGICEGAVTVMQRIEEKDLQ